MQDAFVESCYGRMCDELLKEGLFLGLDHAGDDLSIWGDDCNTGWPRHLAFAVTTPAAFATRLTTATEQRSEPARPLRSGLLQ